MMDLPEKTLPFFPFTSTRPGQDELINEIYYSVSAKKNVIIEAPNGIGKTVSALSSIIPYLKGTKRNRVLIYCTRTHSQMDQVLAELKHIQATKDVQIRGLSFKGRKKMCINQLVIDKAGNSREFVDLCNLLRGKDQCKYLNELNHSEFDVTPYLDKTMSAEDLVIIGKKLSVCPYFLGKKLIANVDLIATTFQYMVNPFIRTIFLKDLQKEMPEIILLFDECHNLPELAMEVGSDKLPLSTVIRARQELQAENSFHPALTILDAHQLLLEKKLKPHLHDSTIDELDFECSESSLKRLIALMNPDPQAMVYTLKALGRRIKKNRMENSNKKRSISYLFRYAQFLELCLNSVDDPQYLHQFLVTRTKTGVRIAHEIKCLDCRIILRQLYEARSTVFLSGTLSPLSAFMEIIGLYPETTSRKAVTSPFSAKQLLIGTISGLNSKYENRTRVIFNKIKDYIVHVANVTPQNTGVFVPSYAYLFHLLQTDLEKQLAKRNIKLFVEQKQFVGKKNDGMIVEFKARAHQGKKGVLIGVLGGRYSEGVDFPGDEMNSVLITGVPLSRPTYHVSKLVEFYDKAYGTQKGRDYGYILPAMRKANQAAGRPVRRLTDKGVIIFLDERYENKYYKRFLSAWIRDKFKKLPSNPKLLAVKIKQFFS